MSGGTRIAPHGAWESPITPDMLAGQTVRLGGIALDGERALWTEGRPAENGRTVLVRAGADGRVEDLTPAPWNVRSRVHEYGGGAFAATCGVVYFVDDADQRLYRLESGAAPVPLTDTGAGRHADPAPSPDGRIVVCVREVHREGVEPENMLVAVRADGAGTSVIARGHDFYAGARWSADGSRLAFLAWDHPDMPWDASVLYVVEVGDGSEPPTPRRVAGGEGESIFQPMWGPDGALWYVSDASGYWNLYRLWEGAARCVVREEAEYGMPLWQFAMSTYGFATPDTLVAASCRRGCWQVNAIHLPTMARTPLPLAVSAVSGLVAGDGQALMLASAADRPQAVLRWHLGRNSVETLRIGADVALDRRWFSLPEAVEFATGGGDTAHGFFYPPASPCFASAAGERPPLVVIGHGGPTGATAPALDLGVQFWTSRGFAVLDVNYRGSTGYGRAYREKLKGQWGVADVEDCVNGARHLAAAGRVDADRMVIRGRSAGGYTVLAALTFHDVFAAGASYYGIGDLEALARDTHKFESRYMDRLVGPYPEQAALYRQRSPVNHVDGLSCPVIFFQGLEDAVVPPNQALMMRDALKSKGIPVACLLFEGEQHGFRRAETIVRCLEAELAFYGRVFGFRAAGDPRPPPMDS